MKGSQLTVSHLRYLENGPYTLVVEPGKCVGISGPSGVGKSQFCRAVTEMIVSSGKLTLDGRSREDFTAPEWRRRIAYLPAESFWWYDTVADHFKGSSLEELTRRCTLLGLSEETVSWKVSRLSTGERQRLALLRTLISVPQVLLLDEPTSALGEEHTLMVEAFVLAFRLQTSCGVIWISHDSLQLERVADLRYEMTKSNLSQVVGIGKGEE